MVLAEIPGTGPAGKFGRMKISGYKIKVNNLPTFSKNLAPTFSDFGTCPKKWEKISGLDWLNRKERTY